MSFIDQIAELEKQKAKLVQAEAKLAAERVAALARLPGDYGYESLNEFIAALKAAAGKGRKGKPGRKAGKAAKAAKPGKRTRVKITPEIREQVIAALRLEGSSGAKVAKQFGISLPSVQNIKKDAGLVKARGASAAPAVEASAPTAS